MTAAEPAADASSAAVPVAAAAAVPVAAVKAKNRFLLTVAPFGPHGGIVGEIPPRHLARGGICVLSEPPVSRFCSRVHPS